MLSDSYVLFVRVPIEAIQKYVSWQDGLYSLTVYWVTRDEFLYEQTVFVCRMNIPGTGHRERRQITYPGEQYRNGVKPSSGDTRCSIRSLLKVQWKGNRTGAKLCPLFCNFLIFAFRVNCNAELCRFFIELVIDDRNHSSDIGRLD